MVGDSVNNDFVEIIYKGTPFMVNPDGVVKIRDRILPQRLNADGYPEVWFRTDDGKGYQTLARVHRLVALAFVPNPENKPEVNHKDYNRQNPSADNLEWVTRLENVRYSSCNRPDYSGDKNPNFGNHILSEKYKNDKQLAIEKQGRRGIQNGRCRKIKLFYKDEFVKEFDYIGLCIKYLVDNYSEFNNYKNKPFEKIEQSIRGRIDASVKNGKSYKEHFRFEKEKR